MAQLTRLVFTALLATAVCGCGGLRNWLGAPGPVEYQRHNAVLHDPFPDNDAGPEVVGGRPREFQKPLPQPVRNRGLLDSWWSSF